MVRQIAFFEFERRVHEKRRDGELLPEELGAVWLEVQRESLGPALRFADEYQYYWSYIPHFVHSPFYVSAYAFGDCLVNSIYARYEQSQEGFAGRYLDMLKAGGTLRHKELLAPFGLDASDPQFWRQGLGVIERMIDELEATLTGTGDSSDQPSGALMTASISSNVAPSGRSPGRLTYCRLPSPSKNRSTSGD